MIMDSTGLCNFLDAAAVHKIRVDWRLQMCKICLYFLLFRFYSFKTELNFVSTIQSVEFTPDYL